MGLPCSVLTTRWVRASLSAGGVLVHDRGFQSLCSLPHTFWLKPVSVFGSSCVTTFITNLHLLPIPSTLAPLGLTLAEPSSLPSSDGSLMAVGYIVSEHYTVRYLPAPPPRVLLMEQQVLFRSQGSCRTIAKTTFTSHPEITTLFTHGVRLMEEIALGYTFWQS